MTSIPICSIAAGYAVWLVTQKVSSARFTLYLYLLLALVSFFQFYRLVLPTYFASSAYHQAASGEWLKIHTNPTEAIVRLDHYYPSLIFYSKRRILVSTPTINTGDFFISNSDLMAKISEGKLKWINGTQADVNRFSDQLSPENFVIHSVTDQESVLEVTATVSAPPETPKIPKARRY
jgi:hypothetical protein